MKPTLASAGAIALILIAANFGVSPARQMQRVIVYGRAAGMLARAMAEGAWARRSRWTECVERARRDV